MAKPALGTHRTQPTRNLLPIYRAGGSEEPRFVALKARELAIAREVEAMSLEELRRWPLLSVNAKTTVSLDFPIGHACDPTPNCAAACYAGSPRAAAEGSLKPAEGCPPDEALKPEDQEVGDHAGVSSRSESNAS